MSTDALELGLDRTIEVLQQLLAERFDMPQGVRIDDPLFAVGRGLSSLEGIEFLCEVEKEFGVRIDDLANVPAGEPPACPGCGEWLRPDVVWFGEMLDPTVIEDAERLAGRCDVMLVVGTSGVVYPAAGLAHLAKRRGARVIVVNPNPSDLDDCADVLVAATAAGALPQLFAPAAT